MMREFPECTKKIANRIASSDQATPVVEGCYTLIINNERIPVRAGEEHLIPGGVRHSGEILAGTRTIHAFGVDRADRVQFLD